MIKVAIAYDFDGTLAQGNIQENSFIPEINMKNAQFWKKVKELAKQNEMDEILAYMYLMVSEANKNNSKIDKESIKNHGKNVKYFNGVETFFKRINNYAKSKKITLEHYIISSGIKEMIEGISIAKNFKYIYASSYYYDQHNVAVWPALAINYTTKTQFLFRINKGISNAWSNTEINKYMPDCERPIPFDRMIYIGDGETDIPAMKMLNYQGGFSIAVYPPNKKGAKDKIKELIQYKRANYVAKADYGENGEIEYIVRAIIDQIVSKHSLEKYRKIK